MSHESTTRFATRPTARTITRATVAALAACFALALGCGNGETPIIGIGNSGNQFNPGPTLEDVARSLVAQPTTPIVTDAMLRSIFDGMLDKARTGDSRAAFIVMSIAEAQRRDRDEEEDD